MKKILLVIPDLTVCGGVANYYNIMLPYLNNSENFDIDILEVGTFGNKSIIIKIIKPLYDSYRFFKTVRKEFFDIIHINPSLDMKSFLRGGLFIKVAKRKGSKVIVFFRGGDKFLEKRVNRGIVSIFKSVYKLSDVFIVLSSETKQTLMQWGIGRPIYIETTVVDEYLFDELDINQKLETMKKTNDYRILFMSRVEKAKGIYELIEAIRLLIYKGHNIFLTIAGDGSVLPQIKRIVKGDSILSNHVNIAGLISGESKIKMLLTNHIFCLPTYHPEGLPNALLEAMAMGLIPITSPIAGIKDFFKDREMGFLISSQNPEEIFRAIERIINLPFEQKKQIIMSNLEVIKKRCIASCVSSRLIDIYKSLFI